MDGLIHNPTFWVSAAFFIFLGLVWRPVGRAIGGGLDGRAEAIEKQLADATKMREEAQAMLASYEAKHKEVEAEAEAMLVHAQEEAVRIQADAKEQLMAAVEKRTAAAEERIAQEEQKAIQDVQKKVVSVAMLVARDMLTQNMQKETDDALVKAAMKDIARIVH